jgi:hypothetical protein
MIQVNCNTLGPVPGNQSRPLLQRYQRTSKLATRLARCMRFFLQSTRALLYLHQFSLTQNICNYRPNANNPRTGLNTGSRAMIAAIRAAHPEMGLKKLTTEVRRVDKSLCGQRKSNKNQNPDLQALTCLFSFNRSTSPCRPRCESKSTSCETLSSLSTGSPTTTTTT